MDFLERRGISREVVESIRFCKEVKGEYIFVKDGELVKYSKKEKTLLPVNKDGSFK